MSTNPDRSDKGLRLSFIVIKWRKRQKLHTIAGNICTACVFDGRSPSIHDNGPQRHNAHPVIFVM
ncbi:hypothetical protein I8752_15340 [Nostocaceae cyanobacterium CENA369]|uniref:Uncharacterized protein n=1 Tax=Dendronalium phyllosphericum CENA369 TaxID=1725256 RepID=A0A8J7LFZ5_9NOST|nr:hypothetical protein [Dendronalium phyllosphericum]MBH8574369.1 hypothetical protein [Dendronalium phyllosphericum CENA369]